MNGNKLNGNGNRGIAENGDARLLRPLLRWAGGKTHLVRNLLQSLPSDYQTRVYREPFLGAGSLFFALKPEKAVLSDANEHLISCYRYVRETCRISRSQLLAENKRCGRAVSSTRSTEHTRTVWLAPSTIIRRQPCYNSPS